jgi:hypothetical protein
MKTLDYVKEHINEIEQDKLLDRRFTKRFIDFIPTTEWELFGYKYTGNEEYIPKEWTEENVLAQLKDDVEFAIEKATNHRGISASLMNGVLISWCIVLENGLENTDYGWYGDELPPPIKSEVVSTIPFGIVRHVHSATTPFGKPIRHT